MNAASTQAESRTQRSGGSQHANCGAGSDTKELPHLIFRPGKIGREPVVVSCPAWLQQNDVVVEDNSGFG